MFVYVCDACGKRIKSNRVGVIKNANGDIFAIASIPEEFKIGVFGIPKQTGPDFDGLGVCSEKCIQEIIERKKLNMDDVSRLDDGWKDQE